MNARSDGDGVKINATRAVSARAVANLGVP
jgi:hypothetical protein